MRVLIVGTLKGHISTAGKIAMARGAQIQHVDDIDAALGGLRTGKGADLILIDVTLDVPLLIQKLTSERISIPVIACGIGSEKEEILRAIKAGAKEYLPLPPDPELIAAVLEAVSQDSTDLIFKDPKMQRVLKMAEQVAPSEASILITGESGTGKEVMARFIHQKSKRNDKRFISVNCAAIPENLLESELFGHEKGAFTGAVARRLGKFEEANGGTLLLDEISEMHVRLQAKLLRAIQEREIDRVGGNHPVKVDIRLLATSNRDLLQAVKNGEFREDLYFRLNVINIEIPPLRERPQDILTLAEYFVGKYSESNGIIKRQFSNEALRAITENHWTGNVRELENTMHRAVLLAQGEAIEVEDIFGFTSASKSATSKTTSNGLVGRTMEDVEREMILGTLDHCLGNRTQAAKILGISIRTLRNKLNEYSAKGMTPKSANAYKAVG
ncbi:Sigma-54-dependent Fis family transcriptional regulator [Candidatus Bealeia paramacronuclearis]|uniref:Sigma-54-dependent Fis family transcriptional regulator n=1 Tax=Candidatus Bealeia paramacronuclearis TaxID=1921001 RepID=A0ABZ2C4K0_9PROT|nr:Sigma-54-dependent Fis family transcriptional regulator [Candidatus Bealeia paramacronuclearis]